MNAQANADDSSRYGKELNQPTSKGLGRMSVRIMF